MEEWAQEAFESIDAGFFSSDAFHNEEALKAAEEYIKRWTSVIEDIRADFGEQ
jgi:hypothetical protein